MKMKFFLSALSLSFCIIAWAQTRQVTGLVIKQVSNEQLQGVTITVKGTNTITTTNEDGHYSIPVFAMQT